MKIWSQAALVTGWPAFNSDSLENVGRRRAILACSWGTLVEGMVFVWTLSCEVCSCRLCVKSSTCGLLQVVSDYNGNAGPQGSVYKAHECSWGASNKPTYSASAACPLASVACPRLIARDT